MYFDKKLLEKEKRYYFIIQEKGYGRKIYEQEKRKREREKAIREGYKIDD